MQPGETNPQFVMSREMICADLVKEGVGYDSQNLGFVFEEIGKYDVCPANTYKVALVIDEGVDFHWYRQNADGTWSHKMASTAVINYDASGNAIYDPEVANRNYGITKNYDVFVGFFAVTSLNNFYPIFG